MLQPLASLKAKVLTMAYKVLRHLVSAPTTLFLPDCSRLTGLAVPRCTKQIPLGPFALAAVIPAVILYGGPLPSLRSLLTCPSSERPPK